MCAHWGRRRSQNPPFGPGRAPAVPSLVLGPYCRLTAKGRDLTSFSIKLVKTAECHQNVTKRPVLVPIFQNGSQMSPLEILRFPFWLAFSHKELMGRFDANSGLSVKMTKCRQCAHPRYRHAKGSQIPPLSRAASCLCGTAPHLLSAVFSTVQELATLHLIMTETGIWDPLRHEACGRSRMGP